LNHFLETNVTNTLIQADGELKRSLDPNKCTLAQFVNEIRSKSAKYIGLTVGSAYINLFNELTVTSILFPLYTCFVRLSAHPERYPSDLWNSLNRVIKKDGIRSLYNGFSVHALFILLVVISMGIFSTILYTVIHNDSSLQSAYTQGRITTQKPDTSTNSL